MTRLVPFLMMTMFSAACTGGSGPGTDPGPDVVTDAGTKSSCGNKVCEMGETPDSCASDCPTVCGDLVCEGKETQDNCPVDCNAKLKVENDSSYAFYYIYFWPCGSSKDYLNHLSGSLPYGYYVEYDTLAPGCWNIEADTSGSTKVLTINNVQLAAAMLYTWKLQ